MRDAAPIIAIVDDDGSVRRALSRLVVTLSYRPIAFGSGEEFLAALAQATPGCALLDCHMPGLRGVEVLDRMRRDGVTVPVILITAFDQPGMRERCMEAGASAYLTKPLAISDVSEAIETALRR
jgi:FixJ family two-component response regulator